MSITTEPTPLSYSGNDSTTEFSITWKYFAKSDVVATLRDSTGTESTWVLDTDYTLSAAGVDSGGTLTATTAPATGETLVISLDPPNTQDSSLPRGGAFPSSTVEDGLDKAAQRDGKLESLFNRALRVPKTDLRTDDDLELPIDTARANKFLKFDGNGVPTAAEGTATLGETGLLSQDTESELTIDTSGSVTPTVSTHSIDTNADAVSDNLDNIVTTNLADGRLLLIRGENSARVVTVRNAQGGAGQINTRDNANVVLGDEKYLLLQRRGSDWYEVQIQATVVDDPTPQLGGNLDLNTNDITGAGNIQLTGNIQTDDGVLFIKEQADADADQAGYGQLWVNTATPNELYFTDDAGTDTRLTGNGLELIASGSLPSANSLTLSSIPQHYKALLLNVTNGSMDTGTRSALVQITGITSNYAGHYVVTTTIADISTFLASTEIISSAASTFNLACWITGYQTGAYLQSVFNSVSTARSSGVSSYLGGTTAVTSLDVIMNNTGNFDAGTYTLYGVR